MPKCDFNKVAEVQKERFFSCRYFSAESFLTSI